MSIGDTGTVFSPGEHDTYYFLFDKSLSEYPESMAMI